MKKEIKLVVSYIERHGFELVRHEKHMIFKNGSLTLTVASTPGDKHTMHNVKRCFRSMGITPLPA